jgi:hypothetical protein
MIKLLLLLLLTACNVSGPEQRNVVAEQNTSMPTATVPESCTYRTAANGEPLPDPVCTPGALNPDVTPDTIRTTICKTGWTTTIRPPTTYTDPLKVRLMKAYHTATPSGRTELDHEVPLELGGAPWAVENLWPELPDPPALAIPGATGVNNRKDKVENAGKSAVCAGRIKLEDAQREIETDWTQLASQLGI